MNGNEGFRHWSVDPDWRWTPEELEAYARVDAAADERRAEQEKRRVHAVHEEFIAGIPEAERTIEQFDFNEAYGE